MGGGEPAESPGHTAWASCGLRTAPKKSDPGEEGCPGASREERLVAKRLLQTSAAKGPQPPSRADVTAPEPTGRESTVRLLRGAGSAAGCRAQAAGPQATAAVRSQRPRPAPPPAPAGARPLPVCPGAGGARNLRGKGARCAKSPRKGCACRRGGAGRPGLDCAVLRL